MSTPVVPSEPSEGEKQFFKIGEVAEIVGVKTHILRYWESEIAALRPMKTRGAHRMYRRSDVELACLIRRLVHDEGYTVAGAKKRLRELRTEEAEAKKPAPVRAAAAREVALRAELLAVRAELSATLQSLESPPAASEEPVRKVTITSITQAQVPAVRRQR